MLFVIAPQQFEQDFQQFWAVYPCHKARKQAEKAWQQVRASQHLPAILEAIEAQKAERAAPGWHPAWPYPASWLRAERWTDDVVIPVRKRLDGRTDSDPCPICGYPDPRHHSRVQCNQLWLEQQRGGPPVEPAS